jgi:hypothetical protein
MQIADQCEPARITNSPENPSAGAASGGEKKGKAIPVTGRAGPQGCETSRLPHFLDNRLTDDGKVVSLTHRPPFTPQEDSWLIAHF